VSPSWCIVSFQAFALAFFLRLCALFRATLLYCFPQQVEPIPLAIEAGLVSLRWHHLHLGSPSCVVAIFVPFGYTVTWVTAAPSRIRLARA
jgi:hypothetical protein